MPTNARKGPKPATRKEVNRTREAAALADPGLMAWLAEQDVELLDYRQL